MKKALIIFLILCGTAIADSYDPGVYNEIIQQGEDFVRYVQVTDSLGHPTDITGRSYLCQFRQTQWAGTSFANLSTVVTNAAQGQLSVILHHGQTQALGGKTGFWDLKETNNVDGTIGFLYKGTLAVSTTVSR